MTAILVLGSLFLGLITQWATPVHRGPAATWRATFDRISILLMGLGFPACAYFGMKNKDNNALICFTGWSFCSCCCNMWFFFSIVGALQSVHFLVNYCNPLTRDTPELCPTSEKAWQTWCHDLQIAQYDADMTAEDCYDRLQNNVHALDVALTLIGLYYVPQIISSCMSFVFGAKLYQQVQSEALVQTPPLVPMDTGLRQVQPDAFAAVGESRRTVKEEDASRGD